MTPAQFDALAQLLRLRGGPPQDAARLVLVEGLTAQQAAERTGLNRRQSYAALQRCREGLELAEAACGVVAAAP